MKKKTRKHPEKSFTGTRRNHNEINFIFWFLFVLRFKTRGEKKRWKISLNVNKTRLMCEVLKGWRWTWCFHIRIKQTNSTFFFILRLFNFSISFRISRGSFFFLFFSSRRCSSGNYPDFFHPCLPNNCKLWRWVWRVCVVFSMVKIPVLDLLVLTTENKFPRNLFSRKFLLETKKYLYNLINQIQSTDFPQVTIAKLIPLNWLVHVLQSSDR